MRLGDVDTNQEIMMHTAAELPMGPQIVLPALPSAACLVLSLVATADQLVTALPPIAGAVLYLLIHNDDVRRHTTTFGAGIRSTGVLHGTTGSTSVVHLISDGTQYLEVARTLGL